MERFKEILAQKALEYTQQDYPDITLEEIKEAMKEEEGAIDVIYDALREWMEERGQKI